MKKIIHIVMIMIVSLVLTMSASKVNAEATMTANLGATPNKTQVQAGETITLQLKIQNIQNAYQNAVTSFSAYMQYNKDFFETVTEDDCSGISYNPEIGMLTAMFTASGDKNIGTITLKVKSNPTGEGTITFSEIVFADGQTEYTDTNRNCKVTLEGTQEPDPDTNTVPETNTTPDTNTTPGTLNIQDNNRVPQTVNKADGTVANKNIPQTGATPVIVATIIFIGILAVVAYRKYTNYKDIQ